ITSSRRWIAARSPCNSRNTSTNRLPASPPRGSLRECQAWPSTRRCSPSSSRSSVASSGADRFGRCTLKRWRVTAWRSFNPAYPIALSGTPAHAAICRAANAVFMPRFSTSSSRCSPLPLGSNPGTSSTRKSSGVARMRAASTAGPDARGSRPAPSSLLLPPDGGGRSLIGDQQTHCHRRDALAPPGKTELLAGGGLDADRVHCDAGVGGQRFAHRGGMRPDLRLLADDGDVGVSEPPATLARQGRAVAEERAAVSVL